MKLVGATNGVITVEEGKASETEVVVVQGMQFDRGYLSPHFVTNQDEMIVELENPYVLIYEEKISSHKGLLPLLEQISQKKVPLLQTELKKDYLAPGSRFQVHQGWVAVKYPGFTAWLEGLAFEPAVPPPRSA